ncbi:MAG: hypothetical protein GF410_00590 [Chitinivibrionales bacterium]|nr:hypothetical protein [Chitinivibrionales bacterium]
MIALSFCAACLWQSCAGLGTAFVFLLEGSPGAGARALWVEPSKPGAYLDSIYAYDTDGFLVLRYVHDTPDVPILERMEIAPGALEIDREYFFRVYTDNGVERIRDTIASAGRPSRGHKHHADTSDTAR